MTQAPTDDLVLAAEAAAARLDTLPVLVVGAASAERWDGETPPAMLNLDAAAEAASTEPHLMISRVVTARRLGLKGLRAYDLLELFAFVRPGRFCLPTGAGLAAALGVSAEGPDEGAESIRIRACAARLLADLSAETYRYRAGAGAAATMMARAGWLWGPHVIDAFGHGPREGAGLSGKNGPPRKKSAGGIQVWDELDEWEDHGPLPPPDDRPVLPDEAAARLKAMLGDGAEDRATQDRFARAATHAFAPRELADGPNLHLLEAGTGTGKTLGYIAPSSLWAEKNGGPVWLATYTKNLQRQLDQELSRLYPDPRVKAARAVIRKGRENYACLLNIEETTRAVLSRQDAIGRAPGNRAEDRDRVLIGLVLRWLRFTRDGDMIGGDFPSWLGPHFGRNRIAGLTDRRGECLYAACAHYRRCFIEKAARKSRHADLVVANHALVMAQTVNRGDDPETPRRFVFDEGHHLFDAADSAFALHLTGMEGAELRRWLRGKESGGSTRARGLAQRLEDLIGDDTSARQQLDACIDAAFHLPSDGWLGRVQTAAAYGPFERFLASVRAHVLARSGADGPYGLEAPAHRPGEGLLAGAEAVAGTLDALMRPMAALAARLVDFLDEEAETLDSQTRGRLDAAARALSLRADLVRGWLAMVSELGATSETSAGDLPGVEIPEKLETVSWLALDRIEGREIDVGMHRHFLDPTAPLADSVLKPAHGIVITSATLRDHGAGEDDWSSADMRVGASHLAVPPKRLHLPSAFDYGSLTRVLVVNDVNKADNARIAAAYRVLFLAAGGGALGLFTAIRRLRAVHAGLAEPLEQNGIALHGQHVDPIDTATLVDMFRADENSCLLGTDAVRDGVDVPGRSLRLIVMDRVPWPRPTLLHRARRAAFGGRSYDETLTRLKLAQAFGRLVRRADDRGVFVILDGQTPSRLLTALPEVVPVERVGLKQAVDITQSSIA
ncbi:ATP-dependent DNA helicase [Eilatimonas milleporae]|uniref:ATP-dependent DNA helicase DinG n=1 Tax=Eilatimonas milleporae TaxID=911205 RepID=A0A3M0BZ47_9PROT|nr:ATP-dependent DNA helicase [Eilatimonas milleporae]RMB01865.1 ATP-dependent DNA helicase DinG [Eilatimonas milleporae]